MSGGCWLVVAVKRNFDRRAFLFDRTIVLSSLKRSNADTKAAWAGIGLNVAACQSGSIDGGGEFFAKRLHQRTQGPGWQLFRAYLNEKIVRAGSGPDGERNRQLAQSGVDHSSPWRPRKSALCK